MIEANQIATKLGFKVKQSSYHTCFYYFASKNAKGESLCVEVTACSSDCKSKNALPVIWHKNGYTKELIPDYWCFNTYVTQEDGRCYGGYNPTHKLSDDGKRFVINFDWHFASTPENFEKVMREIIRLFNA